MEAKVDIRKLQVLNDRINQTLDALNQVRLTVHGLGHSSPYGQAFGGFGTQGFGTPGFGAQGYGSPMQGSIGQTFGYGNPYVQNLGGIGLQHSTPFGPYNNPFVNPMMQGIGMSGINPMTQQNVWGTQGTQGTQGSWNPVGGLFHSNNDVVELRANDPSRIAATFPYALSPQNPLQNPITW